MSVDTGDTHCPFCRGNFRIVLEKVCSAEHTLPICRQFEEYNVLDFVISARRAMGLPCAPEDAN